ncbi:MAG: phosphatidylglycerophosphatase A [Candidatus Omnitrophica bacterium]|nr:phosphatidylglycerophosphatase A [Candidatus Omnitrophota bacterium]
MKIKDFIVKFFASCFGVGFLPLIPGTFGSVVGLFLFYLVRNNTASYILATIVVIVLGFLLSGSAERAVGKKDARCIVIDEVSGIMISFLFIPFEIKFVIFGFFVFRLLDTLKPYPAGKLQCLNGSAGVMLDDLIAGIYTNIVLQMVFRLASL